MPLYPAGLRDFYPRPPRGGRHLTGDDTAVLVQFLSTPSARRATGRSLDVHRRSVISIHALREEGDLSADTLWQQRGNFYPRPPRGGRQNAIKIMMEILEFLSTPSARRATVYITESGTAATDFYPRPPRGGRPPWHRRTCWPKHISIHALREEGDGPSRSFLPGCRYFYPRPPRGGRQQKQRQNLYFQTNYTTFCTNLEEP